MEKGEGTQRNVENNRRVKKEDEEEEQSLVLKSPSKGMKEERESKMKYKE